MKCCLCGKEIHGLGNNPWPVDKTDEARCCDDCNMLTVVPARLAELVDGKCRRDKEEKEKPLKLDRDEFIKFKRETLAPVIEADKRLQEESDKAAKKMAEYTFERIVNMSLDDLIGFVNSCCGYDGIDYKDVIVITAAWCEKNGYEFDFVECMTDMIEELDSIFPGAFDHA